MTGAAPWPRHVPRLVVAVPCSGGHHTVVWRRGALVLIDHDAVADAVLVALGGEPPACLEVRRSWRLGYIEEEPPAISAGLVRSLSSLAAWMGGLGERPAVLPEPLRRMREASLLHTWGRGLRDGPAGGPAQRTFLSRAIARRVRDVALPQMRSACGSRWSDDDVVVEVAWTGHDPSAEGGATTGAARLRVAVAPDWLTSVWVPGLEEVDGGLVLDADHRSLVVARWWPDGDGGWEVRVADEVRPGRDAVEA